MADGGTAEIRHQSPERDVQTPGDKPAISSAGAALSRPEEVSQLRANQPGDQNTMASFTPSDTLLAGFRSPPVDKAETGTGPQFPLKDAYDPQKDYRTADGKLTPRGEQLHQEAESLLHGVAKPDGSLSLKDHGKIMDTIAHDKNLSEADKWDLYKEVCDLERQGRYKDGRLIPGTHNYRVLFDEAKPTGLPESGKGDVVRHIIIDPTNDSYHGGLVYGSASWRSGYHKGEDGIKFHEETEKPLVNWVRGYGYTVDKGDEQASYRQLAALRAMQQGGFDAYARGWNEGFGR